MDLLPYLYIALTTGVVIAVVILAGPHVWTFYQELTLHREELRDRSAQRVLAFDQVALRQMEIEKEVKLAEIAAQNEAKRIENERIQSFKLSASGRETIVMPDGRVISAALNREIVPGSLATHYHYAPSIEVSRAETPQMAGAPIQLPGVTVKSDLVDFLDYIGRPGEIFLALDEAGQPITGRINRLFHIAIAAFTRGGKTNTLRSVVCQLLAQHAVILYVDPAWTDYDFETDEDFRMIKERLAWPPAFDATEIGKIFRYVIAELEKRYEQRRDGQKIAYPLFLVVDELPRVVGLYPDAPEALNRIVKEAAKVGIFAILSAQDFLTKNIQSDSAMRENLRTCWYYGGDLTTARALLDLRNKKEQEIDDGSLGEGVGLFKAPGVQTTKVRVPYSSNEALYKILNAEVLPPPTPAPSLQKPLSINLDDFTGTPQGELTEVDRQVLAAINERLVGGLPIGNNRLSDALEIPQNQIRDSKNKLKVMGLID